MMATRRPTPCYIIRPTRFAEQDSWRLLDLSVDWCKYIAVSGYNRNTHQTSIDVYSFSDSGFRDEAAICLSKEFEKYLSEGNIYRGRLVSLMPCSDIVVTCLCDKLDVIEISKDKLLGSCSVNGNATCLFVTEREIYIGFFHSRRVSVYDVKKLKAINNINLEGLPNGDFPFDITVLNDKIFACVGTDSPGTYSRPLSFERKNGKPLTQFTNPTGGHWYANSLTVSEPLSLVAVVWFNSYYLHKGTHFQTVLYCTKNETNFSFLVAEDESVSRIRISDRGDKMVTGNQVNGEVKLYDMAEIITYEHLTTYLAEQLNERDCANLSDFFALSNDRRNAILKSDSPTHTLLFALEELDFIQLSSVDRLTEAFLELKNSSLLCAVTEIYQQTRTQATMFNRLLAILSTHLTASVLSDLFRYFDISEERKARITFSQNPGLSLLLTLSKKGIIKPDHVGALYGPFNDKQLVQAVAKLHEYRDFIGEARDRLGMVTDVTEERTAFFIHRLKTMIRIWYESMTPVPWKKSCRWKSSELFVGSGLILTTSRSKGSYSDIDERCKLDYSEIFTHDKLKSEPRIILEGDPGSGKTMLSSQLAYDWSEGKFNHIEMLILLPLKFVKKLTLVQAIKEFYLQDDDRLTSKDIESFLQSTTKVVHLLLDGLEEYTGNSTAGGQSEIMEIISEEKYPHCKVVITARSNYVGSLPKYPMLKLGQFGEAERNSYIERVFSESLPTQLKTKELINNSIFLLTLCETPVLFVMVVHSIESIGKQDGNYPDRVSPFIQRILEMLCSSWVPTDRSGWLSHVKPESLSKSEAHVELDEDKKFASGSMRMVREIHIEEDADKTAHQLPLNEVIQSTQASDTTQLREDDKRDPLSGYVKHKNEPSLTLEELAFNGLCREIQQLSWQKGFLERNVINSREWMESGVIVTEERPLLLLLSNPGQNDSQEQVREIKSGLDADETEDLNTMQDEDNWVPDETDKNSSQSAMRVGEPKLQDTMSVQVARKGFSVQEPKKRSSMRVQYTTYPGSNDTHNQQSGNNKEERENSKIEAETKAVLTQVSLHGKFLHKLIQEWFAAKHLSSLLWTSMTSTSLQECVNKHLQYIQPSDLHYILRFTCFLCPPSYRFIVKYLLQKYHSRESGIRDYIKDCTYLCFAEYNGKQGVDEIEVVEEICNETVVIQCRDSRLLQQAKIAVLEIASQNLIPIGKLVLADVVVSANEDGLTLNSAIEMKALDSLKMLELRRWDHKLQDKDYSYILKFISKCHALKNVLLYFPHQPPELDRASMESLPMENKQVYWRLGPKATHRLDTRTGEWKMIPNIGDDEPMSCKRLDVDEGDAIAERTHLYTEKFIDEHGGTLFLSDADISMHVPPKALTGGHMLRIKVPLDPSIYSPSLEVLTRLTPLTICEPDDLLFQLPVKLTLPHCAVIKNPEFHTITVKFGRKANDCNKEMTWVTEKADYSLGEHYCSVFLNHFSGVDLIINSAEEKILRIIPYTKLGHAKKQVLSVWLCNDLESDFHSLTQGEEKNDGLPLHSYDTFRLRCVPGNVDGVVKFNLETLKGNNWRPEETEATVDVNRLSSASKTKCNFRLLSDGQDDEYYMYFLLRISQVFEDEKRETTFALRKMICDLQTPVMFRRPFSQSGTQASHLFQTESLPRTYTAVVYMDPIKNASDDAIITLWLSPFDSATEMFQRFQEEQELQFKHRVDTENSFSVFDDKIAVVTKTIFRNGDWLLSPEEQKVETDRIRFGSRAKFQFIGRRKGKDDSTYIDLQVETFQEEKNKIKFMTDVEIDQLLYEIRRRKTEKRRVSAEGELNSPVAEGDEMPCSSEMKSQLRTLPTLPTKGHGNEAASGFTPLMQNDETSCWRLRRCFLLLKRNLAGDWKDFGRYLNLSDNELNRLSKEYKDDLGESTYQMLCAWKHQNGSEATPEKLIEELMHLGRKDLAEHLQSIRQ